MNLAHRILLIPTGRQNAYFWRACGTKRFVWNEALRAWNDQFACATEAAKAASVVAKTNGLCGTDAKRFVKAAVEEVGGWPNASVLKTAFNEHKYYAFPWLEGIHRDTHAQPFADLQDAFVRYRKGLAKKPKFKKKHKCRDSFYVANDKLSVDSKQIRLPIVGWVKMQEGLRFVGKIMSATVSRTADKWFVSISVETEMPRPIKLKKDGTARLSALPLPEAERSESVGVDLGLTHLATLSTGEVVDAPKPLKTVLGRLRRESRAQARKFAAGKLAFPGDKHYRSNNWRKGNVRLSSLHARVARIRLDFTHKLTTRLCRENQAVVIEDLHVKGMLANHKLARAISDVLWGELRRQLTYKAPIYRTRLVVANRFFPSSKTCWCCGAVKEVLSLSERIFECPCGWVCNRDQNAALNLDDLTYPRLEGNRRLRTGRIGTETSVSVQPSLVEAGTSCPSLGTS